MSTEACELDSSSVREDTVTKYSIRWKLLGNTFSVKVITYLLGPLLNRYIREKETKFIIPFKNVEERKCSVMEEGDIWALFNTREQPNWYALILKRSGGRFSKSSKKGKSHVQVEVKFLELTYDYTSGEANMWSPDQGAGKYKISRDIDVQDNWLFFSHRVKTYLKSPYSYFIYPGKDEVWAVYDRYKRKSSSFFVYVKESSIKMGKIECIKPGKEGFSAHCRIIRQTSQPQVFRLTEQILIYEGLSCFAYSVPYYYADEMGLLKIEHSNNIQRGVPERFVERTLKRRRDDFSDEDFVDQDNAAVDDVCL